MRNNLIREYQEPIIAWESLASTPVERIEEEVQRDLFNIPLPVRLTLVKEHEYVVYPGADGRSSEHEFVVNRFVPVYASDVITMLGHCHKDPIAKKWQGKLGNYPNETLFIMPSINMRRIPERTLMTTMANMALRYRNILDIEVSH